MISIGVTGGIGSGKSVVCSLFEKLHVPVFYADLVAKQIPQIYPEVLTQLVKFFGAESVDLSSKSINSKVMAEIVFTEQEKLLQLNSIIHPYVFKEFDRWKSSKESSAKYVLIEAALIFESGMDEILDYVLAVTADDKLRIKRIVERDHLSADQIKARMLSQLSTEELEQSADFIVKNDGSRDELSSQINFYHTLFSILQKRNEEL